MRTPACVPQSRLKAEKQVFVHPAQPTLGMGHMFLLSYGTWGLTAVFLSSGMMYSFHRVA